MSKDKGAKAPPLTAKQRGERFKQNHLDAGRKEIRRLYATDEHAVLIRKYALELRNE